MPLIKFEQLNKKYDAVEVIHDIDLVMENNEFSVFVGPSGCGKSTLLRMLAGLETVSGGRILMDGKDVTHLEPSERDISMVFQDYALYPHMNVARNLSFGLRLAKYPKDEIKRRVDSVAEMLGLENYLSRKPAELSGGQRQRVAMGRALVRDTSTLLMDEPLSNLDAKLRGHMRAELAVMRERIQKNIVYVTHDQVEAMTLGDRIVVVKDGVIQQHGSPQTLFESPANKFVAGFIGMPPMNFVDAQVHKEKGALVAKGAQFQFDLSRISDSDALSDTRQIIVGVRPSALRTVEAGAAERAVSIPVKVVEYVGSQTILVSELSGQRILAEVDSRFEFKPGDTAHFAVDAADVYVFDRESELAVY